MEKAWSLALWSVLVCRIAIITDNSKGDGTDHIGYEWTGRAHGTLADALATLAVQRWLEQRLVAE